MPLLRQIVFLVFVSITTTHPQAWKWINPKPQGNPLHSVYFINRDSGFCVGDAGTIMRTTDGGELWNVKTCVTGIDLNGVYFPAHGVTGYVVGNCAPLLKA